MAASEGHVVDLRARPDVSADVLETVRRHLIELLGARLLDSAVVEEEGVRLRVATASRITALAAVRAGVRAVGCEDLFLGDAAELATRRALR
ncbi:MAG: hypothetical protein E6G10_06915 [Actinobacteria bacterium]|nr:MAG: hypothetical protein E6G10_06915 [Actinomycetota bacterium]